MRFLSLFSSRKDKTVPDISSGNFSTDWFSYHIQSWQKFLAPFKNKGVSALEIGSFEGRSASFLLEFLPNSRIVCIDTFTNYGDQPDFEKRFDENMSRFGSRVHKIRGQSVGVLDRLISEGQNFDFIYIDGSHARNDVLVDSLLAWKLLKVGGIIVWDDYEWNLRPDRPKEAIDTFLALHAKNLRILRRGYQIVASRT